MKRKKPKIELRYYYMPAGSPILPLLGERWVQNYGTGIEDLHFHNFMEIGFCYYGEGILTLGEEKRKFTERQFTVIPERFPHTTNSMGNTVCKWEYLFVDVEGFLRKNCESAVQAEKMLRRINSGALLMNEKEEPFIAECIIRIMDIMRREEEFYIQEASGLLMALLAGIARLNRTPEQEMLYEEQSRSMRIISDTLDYISDHYRENIKIEQLSANCHLSESHFRRIFSGCMHMSPVEYINLIRVRTACEKLKKTDRSVTDIGTECGFASDSAFNRNFRKLMGMSPAEWRKKGENYEQLLLKFDIRTEEGW